MFPSRAAVRLGSIIACSALLSSHAATVTQTASNSSGNSGFNSSLNWSNALAPAPGNNYVNSGFTLRTPNNSTASFTFAGDSLTFDGENAVFLYKGGNGGTIIVNDLRLSNGSRFSQGGGSGAGIGMTLGGAITLSNGGIIETGAGNALGRSTRVTANIGGSGGIVFRNHEVAGGGLGLTTLQGNNTYTGGTVVGDGVLSHNFRLVVESNLGAGGDISVLGGAQLKLDINTAISSDQNLILATGLAAGSVFLNYSGTDSIAGLSFNGGDTFAAAGTYGAIGSGAMFQNALFLGAGTLTVVPEPAEVSLAIVAGLACLALTRRTRSRV